MTGRRQERWEERIRGREGLQLAGVARGARKGRRRRELRRRTAGALEVTNEVKLGGAGAELGVGAELPARRRVDLRGCGERISARASDGLTRGIFSFDPPGRSDAP